jgi:hypothetical protein
VYPIPIELEFVKPVRAVRSFLNELGKLRFDPGRWEAASALRRVRIVLVGVARADFTISSI